MDIGESAAGECGRHLFWWYTPKKLTPNYRRFWTQKNVSLETAFQDFLFKILQFGWSCSYILNIILCMKDVLLKNEEQRIFEKTPSQCQRKSSDVSRIFQKDRVQLFCDRFNSFNNFFLSTSGFYVNQLGGQNWEMPLAFII